MKKVIFKRQQKSYSLAVIIIAGTSLTFQREKIGSRPCCDSVATWEDVLSTHKVIKEHKLPEKLNK